AAIEAGRPAAVVLLELAERVLPVVPEPLLVQPGVEVVPGQHLVGVPLTRGVPADVHPGQLSGAQPAIVGEVLRPAVEPPAVLPYRLDHRADPAVAAGQQSLAERPRTAAVAHPRAARQC